MAHTQHQLHIGRQAAIRSVEINSRGCNHFSPLFVILLLEARELGLCFLLHRGVFPLLCLGQCVSASGHLTLNPNHIRQLLLGLAASQVAAQSTVFNKRLAPSSSPRVRSSLRFLDSSDNTLSVSSPGDPMWSNTIRKFPLAHRLPVF